MTHGLYSDVLNEDERQDLEVAAQIAGLDQEIALLRVKLKRAAKRQPNNLAVILKALDTLAKALVARHRITGDASKSLDDAMSRVITEITNELGVTE